LHWIMIELFKAGGWTLKKILRPSVDTIHQPHCRIKQE